MRDPISTSVERFYSCSMVPHVLIQGQVQVHVEVRLFNYFFYAVLFETVPSNGKKLTTKKHTKMVYKMQ